MKTSREPVPVELISRLQKSTPISETSHTEDVPDSEEEMYLAAGFLQKTVKDHATQTLV
jgi:hypothetical protein